MTIRAETTERQGVLLRSARHLLLAWVACYTLRLQPSIAERRTGEVVSDLWEQIEAAERQGLASWVMACDVLLRLMLGIPADISWRIAQLRSDGRDETMLATARNNGLAGLASALTVSAAVFWIVLALYSLAGEHISSTAEDIAFVLALLAAVALTVAAIAAGTRSAWQPAIVLLVLALAVFVVTMVFAPTTW